VTVVDMDGYHRKTKQNYLPLRQEINAAHKLLILRTIQQSIKVLESTSYVDKDAQRRARLMLSAYKEIEELISPATAKLEVITPYRKATDD